MKLVLRATSSVSWLNWVEAPMALHRATILKKGEARICHLLEGLPLDTDCCTSLRISLPGVSHREKRLKGKLHVILTRIHFLLPILKVKVKWTRSLVKD